MSQEKVKVEGLVKTEPQAIKEEYEETHFHAKPLDIKEEYQEDSLYTEHVGFPKSVTPGIKPDSHNINTTVTTTADDSKRKLISASPFGSSVNKTTTTLPSPLLFLSKSFQTQLTKKPRLVQTTNSITTSLSGSLPKPISEPPPFTFRHPEEPVKCPKCSNRPKYKNLSKHLAKHARGGNSCWPGSEEDLKNKREREKLEKDQKDLETFKARSAEAAARAELKFAQLAPPSSSFEAEIPEEDPAGDMFSWSPPSSP